MKKSVRMFLFVSLMAGLTSPILAQKKAKKYLPKEVRKLSFDISLDQATAKVPGLKLEREESFRSIYSWAGIAGLNSVILYFDKDHHQPLYEYILQYPSEEQRDLAARQLLGEPNQPEDEWRWRSREGYPIKAWTFQNKLIITALLADTEWAE